MNEMVERVARALASVDGADPDAPNGAVQGAVKSRWKLYIDDARAAIAAMRVPTEAMIRAGFGASLELRRTDEAAEIWHAFIDEALKPETPPETKP